MDDDERDFWSDDEWGDHDGGTNPPDDDYIPDDEAQHDLREILGLLGKDSAIDFLVNLKSVEDGSTIRADRFSTLEDAIYFLFEIGVGSFSDVIELELNVYAVTIPHDTP